MLGNEDTILWGDFKIGRGDAGNASHAVAGAEGSFSISSNDKAFWISEVVLDIGFRVMRNTPEGSNIQGYVDTRNWKGLSLYLDYLALDLCPRQKMLEQIKEAEKKAEQRGRKKAQKAIRKELGLK